jgi:ABC-type dipeptide/oligopeptide/nickel transport system ATPase component
MTANEPLMRVEISAGYPGRAEVLRAMRLSVDRGEIVGLVGESGCGKSTLALAILRLLHLKGARATGSIRFDGLELLEQSEQAMRRMRGRSIGLVLQSPLAALNPALRLGTQMEEAWRLHRAGSRGELRRALLETLELVALPAGDAFLRRYPRELSVGQAQRVLIGMALLHRPPLLIADEPTSALDILTQAEILELFRTLSGKLGTSILFISHDLLSVAAISQRVAVMQSGRIVECRAAKDLFRSPEHPYTQRLIAAMPAAPRFDAQCSAV